MYISHGYFKNIVMAVEAALFVFAENEDLREFHFIVIVHFELTDHENEHATGDRSLLNKHVITLKGNLV